MVVASGVVDLCPVELRELCGYGPRRVELDMMFVVAVKVVVSGFMVVTISCSSN